MGIQGGLIQPGAYHQASAPAVPAGKTVIAFRVCMQVIVHQPGEFLHVKRQPVIVCFAIHAGFIPRVGRCRNGVADADAAAGGKAELTTAVAGGKTVETLHQGAEEMQAVFTGKMPGLEKTVQVAGIKCFQFNC